MRKLKIAIWLNFIYALGLKTSHKFLFSNKFLTLL